MQNINEIKDQICDVCHKMWQLGWVAANDGNVSVRLEDGRILATPTGMRSSFITPEAGAAGSGGQCVGKSRRGPRPSSEIKMHLRCYDKRDDVMSVIHAHPPGATGFAVAHKAMDMYKMIEDVAVIGAVPLTPYVSFPPWKCPTRLSHTWRSTMMRRWRTTVHWLLAAMSSLPFIVWKAWNCGPRSPLTL